MKICGISDIHGNLYNGIPKCDVLCICGDIIPLNEQRSMDASATWWTRRFTKWANELPCKKIIVVPGNHDFYLEKLYNEEAWAETKEVMRGMTGNKVEMLIDESYTYEGTTFYGTPWIKPIEYQPGKWAFEYPTDEVEDNPFKKIPKCDILLTHDNPNYNNELFYYSSGRYKHHLFGHWHDGVSYGHIGQHNCSILDDGYNFKKNLEIVTIDIMTEDKRQEIIDEILLRLQTISNLTQTVEFSKQLSDLIQNYSEELRAEIPVKEDEVEWDTSGNFVTDTNTIEEDFIVNSNIFEETKTAA